ncbi:MAG TPA: BamA/TamA family outer membrane protein [Ignavibacteriaceae bacterium]|nr:BamA/TamA family outer membrane protein [Ignavibacteriaceae bacterium]
MKRIILISLLLLLCKISFAQLYFFGRNKVQYEHFDWRVLKTEHFDIYYYNETEEIAEIGGYYAEDAYNDYKVKLNCIVTHRIPLIFYNTHIHFQQTNTTPGFIPEGVGGFFEFIKGRVVIPSMGSLSDFRHVIRHELAHVFMTNKIYRVLSDHRLPSDEYPPLWFVEGFAEYMSTKIDAQAEMVLRDAVINNYFVQLNNISSIYGTFLMYKEGQCFLEFVEEKYGSEKVPLLLENFWMDNNFNKVIEHTLGKKIEEIDSEWLFYLKRKYYPLLQDKAPLEHAAKKITDFGFNFSPVKYNIDGKDYIYFIANRDGYSSLYRMEYNPANNEMPDPELVLRGEKTEEFESFHLFQSSIDISSGGLLAFVTKSGPTDAIHFYSLIQKKIVYRYQNHELISISSPKFSPDGDKITFSAVDQKGFSDIFILNTANDSLIRLTNDYYNDQDPIFGLNENQILFSSDRTAGLYEKIHNLFSYDLTTHKISYVTYLNCNNSSPLFSPDKKHLFFLSEKDKVSNLWSLDINDGNFSTEVRQVTNFITSSFNPFFIDSTKIVFSGFENFSFNLYTLDLKDTTRLADSVTYVSSNRPSNVNLFKMNMELSSGSWKAEKLIAATQEQNLKYEKEYTLDYAQSQISTDPVFGTRGGALFSLSDLLGDDNYFFLIYNTADVQSEFLKSFNIAIQRINLSERANYGYGVFHFSGRRYDIRESDEYFFERSFGGFFLLNFPLSKFQRIETDVSIANSDKEVIAGLLERKALLLSNSISFVHDNSLWGPSGPLDGERIRLLLGYTGDIKFSNVNYFTAIADLRYYYRIALSTSIALRSAIFYNEGKEARRYFMGGSWDLRGWPRWSIRGEKMWLSSVELRFPLIDEIQIRFPFFGLGFFGIRGAAFFDAGGAWDTDYTSTLGSLGFGFRFNLFNVLVLRYDIGKKIENDFSRLQKGLFYQFFFGWDF